MQNPVDNTEPSLILLGFPILPLGFKFSDNVIYAITSFPYLNLIRKHNGPVARTLAPFAFWGLMLFLSPGLKQSLRVEIVLLFDGKSSSLIGLVIRRRFCFFFAEISLP